MRAQILLIGIFSISKCSEDPQELPEPPLPKICKRIDYSPRFPESDIFGRCQEGDFEVKRFLGSGSFGRVYEAYHKVTGYRVAYKKLFTAPKNDYEETVPRKLNHRNIAKHHCSFKSWDGGIVFASDYFPNGQLKHVMEKDKYRHLLTNENLVKWMAQIYSALHHMHLRGIGHTDLTMDNIMLDQKYNAIIIDLGNAAKFSRPGSVMVRDYRMFGEIVAKMCPMLGSELSKSCYRFQSGLRSGENSINFSFHNFDANQQLNLFRAWDWSQFE